MFAQYQYRSFRHHQIIELNSLQKVLPTKTIQIHKNVAIDCELLLDTAHNDSKNQETVLLSSFLQMLSWNL